MAASGAVHPSLTKGLTGALESKKYSDLLIVCGDRKWSVHKVVLCTQSSFFAKACDGKFKEASEKRIDLLDDDPHVVNAMLRFFYSCDYEDTASYLPKLTVDWPKVTAGLFHIMVFMIADKYDVQALAQLAGIKFSVQIERLWNTSELPTAIKAIYESPTADNARLRRVVVAATCEHAKMLLPANNERFAEFRSVVSKLPAFLMEVSTEMATGKYKY